MQFIRIAIIEIRSNHVYFWTIFWKQFVLGQGGVIERLATEYAMTLIIIEFKCEIETGDQLMSLCDC